MVPIPSEMYIENSDNRNREMKVRAPVTSAVYNPFIRESARFISSYYI